MTQTQFPFYCKTGSLLRIDFKTRKSNYVPVDFRKRIKTENTKIENECCALYVRVVTIEKNINKETTRIFFKLAPALPGDDLLSAVGWSRLNESWFYYYHNTSQILGSSPAVKLTLVEY